MKKESSGVNFAFAMGDHSQPAILSNNKIVCYCMHLAVKIATGNKSETLYKCEELLLLMK